MAEDAVNAAIKSGQLSPISGCLTHKLQLVGADGWEPSSFTVLAQQYMRMKKAHGGKVVPGAMDTAAAKHLSHAYGTMAERVATIAQVRFILHFLHKVFFLVICYCIIIYWLQQFWISRKFYALNSMFAF